MRPASEELPEFADVQFRRLLQSILSEQEPKLAGVGFAPGQIVVLDYPFDVPIWKCFQVGAEDV